MRCDDRKPMLPPAGALLDRADRFGHRRRGDFGRIAACGSARRLRGDNERITIGARSNIQEGSTLHTDLGFPLTIGEDCTIGHNAILHGCTIGDGSLVGMGASCSTARESAAAA